MANDARRTVFLDGRPRPLNQPPTPLGHSIGRFEGEALVIESDGIAANWTRYLSEHSDQLRIVERYVRDGDRLLLTATMIDPWGLKEPSLGPEGTTGTEEGVALCADVRDRSIYRLRAPDGVPQGAVRTMSREAIGVVSLVMTMVATPAVRAHHSFAPVYDEQKTITVSGVAREFRFVNPHAMMSMDVTDPATRAVTVWTVEFSGRLNLSEAGWSEKSIQPGERLTVSGNPTHTGSPRMFFRRIVKADGTQLLPGAAQRGEELEDLRRQRARDRRRQP